MSTEPENELSLLAPLADAYEPTAVDADRVLAKIEASLASTAASPCSAAADSPARAGAAAGVRGGKKALLVGLSCLTMALVGVAVFETTRLSSTADTEPPKAGLTKHESPSNATLVPPRAAEEVPAMPSISVDALPSAAVVPPAGRDPRLPAVSVTASAPVAPGPVPAPVAPADTLEQEARLLAAARHAVSGGDAEHALALLDEHARVFPNGWLASDRAAERVVVLCSLGRRAEATREATAFLAGRSPSPLTRRVEMSCAGAP